MLCKTCFFKNKITRVYAILHIFQVFITLNCKLKKHKFIIENKCNGKIGGCARLLIRTVLFLSNLVKKKEKNFVFSQELKASYEVCEYRLLILINKHLKHN